jgi:hypothetical protein
MDAYWHKAGPNAAGFLKIFVVIGDASFVIRISFDFRFSTVLLSAHCWTGMDHLPLPSII